MYSYLRRKNIKRNFNIITNIEASEETWANIDNAVARIMACDVKRQIEDICLSTLEVKNGVLRPVPSIIVVGRIDYDIQDAIEALNIPWLMIEIVCPPSATLSVYPRPSLIERIRLLDET